MLLWLLCIPAGKLSRGGEPDLNTAAKMVLYDWQRGKIPFFTLPPDYTEDAPAAGAAAAGGSNEQGGVVLPSQAVTVRGWGRPGKGWAGVKLEQGGGPERSWPGGEAWNGGRVA